MKTTLFIILVLLAILIIPVSGEITITPENVTSSSIMWSWDPITIQNLSIDGMYVCSFNPTATSFILSDLGQNEPHTITVITATDSGSNTTYTAGNAGSQASTESVSLFNQWFYLGLILLLCVVGMMRKLGIFLIVASIVSLYALIEFIGTNTPGADPLVQLPFLIYVAFFIIPLWLCFGVKGGVFK